MTGAQAEIAARALLLAGVKLHDIRKVADRDPYSGDVLRRPFLH
jgi:hypothetical protein